jgi:hypothetical protein
MRLGLLPPTQRPTLDEARTAPLRKADVDDIEVPRHDRLRERDARLAHDLGAEVPIREMCEDEHLDAGFTCQLCSAEGCRVERLVCAVLLLRRERGVVHEDIGVASSFEDLARRARVARQGHLAPMSRRTENLVRLDCASFGQRDGVAVLQPAEEWPLRNTQRAGSLKVEASGTRRFEQCIAVCRDAVFDLERCDTVIPAVDRVAGSKFDELELVRELSEHATKDREEVHEPGRAVHRKRRLPTPQRKRLQHPGQAEVVVRVVMGEEDLRQLDQADRRPQELALRPFAAVEQDAVAAAADQRPG